MARKTLVLKKTITLTNDTFHALEFNLGRNVILHNVVLEAGIVLANDNDYVAIHLSTEKHVGIGNPTTRGLILWDKKLAHLFTSGLLLLSSRWEYDLLDRKLNLKEGKLYVGLHADDASGGRRIAVTIKYSVIS